ncbi:cytochrome P450 [Spinellus fusiger]|nr:cytochrome P450 [Spinellus fusiger]KAI7865852.1 cytochrome P450 [Spinellus fusiger]
MSSFLSLPNPQVISEILNDSKLPLMSAVALVTAAYSVYYIMKKDKNQDFSSIPMPKGNYPIVGHIPHLVKSLELKLHEWHKELGPIIHIKMGAKDFIIISDPGLAHKVFVTNGVSTSSRPPHRFSDKYHSHDGRGVIFANYGKRWTDARAAVANFLSPKAVNASNDVLLFEAKNLIKELIAQTKSKKSVNPFNYANCASLNVVLGLYCTMRVDSSEDPLYKEIMDAIDVIVQKASFEEDISSYIPALSFIDYIRGKDKKDSEWVRNSRDPLMKKLLKEAFESDTNSAFKKIHESNEKTQFEEKDFIVIMNDIIAAGTDTVATTISWAFLFLSHHPEIQKKICDEIDTFVTKHERLPDFSEREHFPYMVSVQREILRHIPISTLSIPHVADKDIIIDNYLIKKGSTLLSNMYTMHLDPDVYSEPDKFIPERYMNNKSTMFASANGNTSERDHFNFGWGRRICPGIYLAEAELFYVYVNLWSRCTIEPMLDSNNNPVYTDYTISIPYGLTLRPTPHELRFVERPDKLL